MFLSLEYLGERAPHPIREPIEGRKALEKKLKGKKVGKLVFRPVFEELEKSLEVLRNYEPHWKKEHSAERARRALLEQINFDLNNPPPLQEFLTSAEQTNQLRCFATTIFCEEIVLFYQDWSRFEAEPTFKLGKELCERYMHDESDLMLNLEFETRHRVVSYFQKTPNEELNVAIFETTRNEVVQQIAQNLYGPFIAHLRAISKDLAAQGELQEFHARKGSDSALKESIPQFENICFIDVISDPIQLLELVSFAGRMYSQERLVFYILVEDFRALPTDALRSPVAKRIFEEYVKQGAKRQVSLEGRRYKKLESGFMEYCAKSTTGLPSGVEASFFDAAAKEVRRSIEHEIFPLFAAEQKLQWEREVGGDVVEGEQTASSAPTWQQGKKEGGKKTGLRSLLKKSHDDYLI